MGKPVNEDLKREAAAMALLEVRPGMKLGLGTGSTAKHFVDLLGARVAEVGVQGGVGGGGAGMTLIKSPHSIGLAPRGSAAPRVLKVRARGTRAPTSQRLALPMRRRRTG